MTTALRASILLALTAAACSSGGDEDDEGDAGSDGAPVDVPAELTQLLSGADQVEWDLGMYVPRVDCLDDTWLVETYEYEGAELVNVVGVVVDPAAGTLGPSIAFQETDGEWASATPAETVGVSCPEQQTMLMAIYGRTTDGLITSPGFATGVPSQDVAYSFGYMGVGSTSEISVEVEPEIGSVSGLISIFDPFYGVSLGPTLMTRTDDGAWQYLTYEYDDRGFNQRDLSDTIIGVELSVDDVPVEVLGI